jgi:hypothetical protein
MSEDWYPGAVRNPQPGGGGYNDALPPRVVWHITWDALGPGGARPSFEAVSGYLQSKEYCSTLMWDPFTGHVEQFYPASQSARALVAWNEDGAVNIQVEALFSPGCVVDGVTYATLADTPCVGLGDLLNWMDGFGIPRVWPMGSPQWQGNSRDVGIWNSQAGHYGHCNVPDNTHTDPGPMPPLTGTTTQGYTPQEDDMANVSDDQLNFMLKALASLVDNAATKKDLADQAGKTPAQVWAYQNPAIGGGDAFQHLRDIPAAVLNQTFVLPDGTKTNVAGILAAIDAKPSGTAAPAAVDVDALVNRLKTELPSAMLADLATRLAN